MSLTPEEHKQRHIDLHKALDELVSDYVLHTKRGLGLTNVLDLIRWSHEQTLNPKELPS